MKTLQFIQDPATLVPLSDTPPTAEFTRLVTNRGGRIAETVCAAKQKQPRLKDFRLRMGMVFPPNAILDEEIRGLCQIPFRHQEGGVFGCEGVVEGWKGCPPRSPGVAETVANLKTARAMLLLQFDGIQDAPQDIQWVTDWNLPGQSPKTFKSVTGVLFG